MAICIMKRELAEFWNYIKISRFTQYKYKSIQTSIRQLNKAKTYIFDFNKGDQGTF